MFEKDQTVVCATKACSSQRNARRSSAQLSSFARLWMAGAWRLEHTWRQSLEGVWHAKKGATFARMEFGFIAGLTYRRLLSSYRDLWLPMGLCALLLVMACPDSAHAASGRVTIESGGTTRSAILVEHARLKKTRRPVVIILHAGNSSAGQVRHILGLEEKARSAAPVMVYPEASDKHWADAAKPGDTRDTVFIHDLIAKLISEGIADRRRIFIVGGSSGGLMALKLACSGEDFAGVVAIFASLPADLAANCKPAHPLPFLLILGTADPFVPYNGGDANLVDSKAALLPGSATLELFATAAGCGDGHTTTTFADHGTKDNSRAYLDKLNGCKVPVELLRIEGGGHLLPRTGALGSGARLPEVERAASPGMRNRDVDAPLLIWDFLRHLGA